MINYEEVGTRMKLRRIELGLSLNQAAMRMNCTATTLKRWEDGYTKSVKTTKLKQIADALQTTPEALLGVADNYIPRSDLMPADPMEGDVSIQMPDDSMINARIWPGDIVHIRKIRDIPDGSIIVADYKDDLIIRRIFRYPGRIELRSENPLYPAITIEGTNLNHFNIIGKAVSIYGEIK